MTEERQGAIAEPVMERRMSARPATGEEAGRSLPRRTGETLDAADRLRAAIDSTLQTDADIRHGLTRMTREV
ncbi:hypothetical protein ACFMQL_39065 [Nonomuraea fastidiosa]|uniref:hypothetical protein n=1 Tax=Nonomuraea TaxID=83681 RepID=UPI0032489616